MKFEEAVSLLKPGFKFTRNSWEHNKYYYFDGNRLILAGEFVSTGNYTHANSVPLSYDDLRADDWYIIHPNSSLNETFGFGKAIELLVAGKKVARKGWNGKGMYIYYVTEAKYKRCTEAAKDIADANDMVHYNAYFAIKNVNNTVSTWVPSINDCLAKDWYEVLD